VSAAKGRLSPDFDRIRPAFDRGSIGPKKLAWVRLPRAFFSLCSERQMMKQITDNMMFRRFVGMLIDASVWHEGIHQTSPPADAAEPTGTGTVYWRAAT
jgi:hypothetical protein